MNYYGAQGITGTKLPPPVRSRSRASGTFGFYLPESTAEAASGAAPVTMPGLLALQEAGQDAGRDRDARRHGEAMLTSLADLQRALLGGADRGALQSLADLARRAPPAADPRLAGVQRALLLRVEVELARARAAASA